MSADGEACGDHCSCGETAPLPSGVRYDAFADTPKNGGWGRLAFADGYHVYHAHTSFIASGGGRCLRYVPIFKSGNDAIRFNLRAMTLRAAAAERDAAGAEPGTAGDGNRSAIRWGEVSNREEGPYLKKFCHRGVVHFTFVREPASHLLSALREHMWQQCFVQSRTTPLRPSGVAWANRHCARTPYGRALAQNLAYFAQVSTSELIMRSSQDSRVLRSILTATVLQFIQGLMILVGVLVSIDFSPDGVLMGYMPRFAIAAGVMIIALLLFAGFYAVWARSANLLVRQSMGRLMGFTLEVCSPIALDSLSL